MMGLRREKRTISKNYEKNQFSDKLLKAKLLIWQNIIDFNNPFIWVMFISNKYLKILLSGLLYFQRKPK